MGETFWTVLAGLIAAAIAATPGTLAYMNQRKTESRADRDSAVDAWQEMLEPMRRRLTDVEAELHELRKENKLLRHGIDLLLRQMESLGIQPVWYWHDTED